jgi:hypothetical protein
MTRGLVWAALVVVVGALLAASGCATKDDSVWGRVERIGSPDAAPEPGCRGNVPPVITPGQAKQDSLNRLPDEDREEPSSG